MNEQAASAIKLQGFYPETLDIKNIRESGDQIEIEMKSRKHSAKCPGCGEEGDRYHAVYERRVQDLPILGKNVTLKIASYDYYCANANCEVRSYAEDYDEFIGRSARMTSRLESFIRILALETSCEGASYICGEMGIRVSGDTIIRMLRKLVGAPVAKSGETIGVDDFANAKGRTYCTVICDGETHKAIEVLEGRDSAGLSAWLSENKHVKKVTRDRAGAYAKAISETLPWAMQIADRFHLHQNLLEAVKDALNAAIPNEVLIPNEMPAPENGGRAEKPEAQSGGEKKNGGLSVAERNRYERIVQIQEYYAQGYTQASIMRQMKLTHNTVGKYAKGDPWKLCQHAARGCAKGANYEDYREEIVGYLGQNVPFKEICARITANGYTGRETQVRQYCHRLIAELELEHSPRRNTVGVPVKKGQKFDTHCLKKSDIFEYIWSDKELDIADAVYIMAKYPDLWEIYRCVRDFRRVYLEKSTEQLLYFIVTYSMSAIKPIKSFANGLSLDIEAVTNSFMTDLSNGFVEGANNKIKAIKRTMYGRAKIDLLRVKILHAR